MCCLVAFSGVMNSAVWHLIESTSNSFSLRYAVVKKACCVKRSIVIQILFCAFVWLKMHALKSIVVRFNHFWEKCSSSNLRCPFIPIWVLLALVVRTWFHCSMILKREDVFIFKGFVRFSSIHLPSWRFLRIGVLSCLREITTGKRNMCSSTCVIMQAKLVCFAVPRSYVSFWTRPNIQKVFHDRPKLIWFCRLVCASLINWCHSIHVVVKSMRFSMMLTGQRQVFIQNLWQRSFPKPSSG